MFDFLFVDKQIKFHFHVVGFSVDLNDLSTELAKRPFSHPMTNSMENDEKEVNKVISRLNYQTLFNSFRSYRKHLENTTPEFSAPVSQLKPAGSKFQKDFQIQTVSSFQLDDKENFDQKTRRSGKTKDDVDKSSKQKFAFNPSAGSMANVEFTISGFKPNKNNNHISKIPFFKVNLLA